MFAAENNNTAKIAIVGMDAFFGECNGLDAFERSIYDGKQHFITLPPKRWYGIDEQKDLLQEYGLTDGKAPVGAYIKDFDLDTLAYKIPPNEVEKLNPQQLLLLTVADRALKDAKIPEGGNVAVIIAAEAELSVHKLQQRWDSSWQVKDGLNAAEITLPSTQVSQLESIVKDSVHHQVEIGEYLSYITNIMASRISSLWNFTGPSFTLTAVESSAFKAVEVAQMLLMTQEVDAVVVGAVDLAGGVENVLLRSQTAPINTGANTLSYDQKANGWTVGEGAGAVVLKRHQQAIENGDRIYAVIDAISIGQSHTKVYGGSVNQACQQALKMAGVPPEQVKYVEVCASGIPQEDEAEIAGLVQAYPSVGDGLHCAIGSVKANIGHTFVASGIASLIKTALCLYYRYIPATPNWSGVKTPQAFEGSPFYVVTESRPWFLSKNASRRIAAINGMGCDGSYAHVILSEETNQAERPNQYLEQMPFLLFPVAGDDRTSLLEALDKLQKSIAESADFSRSASLAFTTFQQQSQANYAVSITGRNKKELLREIESARKGINTAFDKGTDWQTPVGSYFTAQPLGKKGEVAYVYPAAVNSYIGIGRNLFRLFPKLHDNSFVKSLYKRAADIERLVFPRSLSKLSTRQLEQLEKKLLSDSLAMFEAEIFCTRLLTTIIRDDFQVHPKYVFGYSLGETSMMVAQGIWSNFSEVSNSFNSSTLFGDRLSGPKNSVREYWGLPKAATASGDNLWGNYVLMASPVQVRDAIRNEPRVYLTQINTPEEVLIAGDPAACQRVIKTIGCNSFTAPFDHVIHCQAMRSEYDEFVQLNSLPVQDIADITFYSAAEYQPIKLETGVVAKSLATGLSQELDFPKLVNRIYDDGAKIFIEAGPGSVCSRWIDKILEDKEHITVSLNRRGIDDHTSFVKALAKLVSHRVNVDLSPLYSPVIETSNLNKVTLRKITVGGDSISGKILSPENLQLFAEIREKKQQNIAPSGNALGINSTYLSHQKSLPKPKPFSAENIIEHGLKPEEPLKSSELTATQPAKPSDFLSNTTTDIEFATIINMLDLNKAQYQKLNANNLQITQNHTAFLKARQDFSQQMSEIIQLQMVCAEDLLQEDGN
ncbi:Beta-ketoacyl synthase [Trichormus variabilis ATCC 29413]|uniref:Beta-ketoacyl synthase n=2 Tax=Anabaena variabilis TaxID=264691 RepID=Q3M9X8_TRIV2|nr:MULTISPECIES: type I polyketide synthase [Nostocaceae]ABA22208.1 Beta-ketoacyl synthase [Trichormus variabilis ATCC 29413]MBC1217667.1 type I polyketide synthase [Trichormus variabilis ARAD]MBC1254328.1 type I polyketide synthase [Trichormus variabilis V5]MBC1268050.1 type I polyketide synthase [Trichormus variabilis FSR]MBC1301252.1 type I polyketide synthase [Trichormus variabilis N2B]